MLDRCYLTESVPVQLIWGERDSVLPVSQARLAHAAMPGSRLEVFEGSGHFPFHDDPDRFVEVVERFIDSTEPATYDQDLLRDLLRTGMSCPVSSRPVLIFEQCLEGAVVVGVVGDSVLASSAR